MDIATVIGLILGVTLVLIAILIGGGLGPFIDIGSMLIVIGGSISAILINFPLGNVLGVFGVVKNCFFTKLPSQQEIIETFSDYATVVRKDGILALEAKLEEVSDDFLKRGVEMVIAGTGRDDIENVMETEVGYIDGRHQTGKKIVEAVAAAAPAFGMIGTLIGLVQMLQSLDDPSKIGIGMATALLTTLYGAMIANMFCIPLSGKLEQRNAEETNVRELMIAGLVGLVDGQTPRALEEKLAAYVAPAARKKAEAA